MFSIALRKASARKFLTQNVMRFMSSDTFVIENAAENDHQPITKDDSLEGRYASVLFTTASKDDLLHKVYEDMMYLSELWNSSAEFKSLTYNPGLSTDQLSELTGALDDVGDLAPLTIRFMEVLAENKRFSELDNISKMYQKLYLELNKEEKITIISATDLDSTEKEKVLDALKQNPDNIGKTFTLEFQVDSNIKGGLIMYTESEFMDMSLSSRIAMIRQQVNALSQ